MWPGSILPTGNPFATVSTANMSAIDTCGAVLEASVSTISIAIAGRPSGLLRRIRPMRCLADTSERVGRALMMTLARWLSQPSVRTSMYVSASTSPLSSSSYIFCRAAAGMALVMARTRMRLPSSFSSSDNISAMTFGCAMLSPGMQAMMGVLPASISCAAIATTISLRAVSCISCLRLLLSYSPTLLIAKVCAMVAGAGTATGMTDDSMSSCIASLRSSRCIIAGSRLSRLRDAWYSGVAVKPMISVSGLISLMIRRLLVPSALWPSSRNMMSKCSSTRFLSAV